MQNETLLKLEDVTFRYGNTPVLENANLILSAGKSIGIVGDNGTGKSTIVKLLLGLIRPEKGQVELLGKPVSWRSHHHDLGYIGDPSHNPGELGLPDGISVEEMVKCFRQLCDIPPVSDTRDNQSRQELWQLPLGDFFNRLIELLNIRTLYSRDVGRLSNGERKKLMTLLALGKRPRLLIAYEATEGLDKNAKPIILDIIEEGISSQMFALLWISHRWDEIVRLGHTIYELSPTEAERGQLKELSVSQFGIDININSKGRVENLRKDLKFSLLGTLLSHEDSRYINDINININRLLF